MNSVENNDTDVQVPEKEQEPGDDGYCLPRLADNRVYGFKFSSQTPIHRIGFIERLMLRGADAEYLPAYAHDMVRFNRARIGHMYGTGGVGLTAKEEASLVNTINCRPTFCFARPKSRFCHNQRLCPFCHARSVVNYFAAVEYAFGVGGVPLLWQPDKFVPYEYPSFFRDRDKEQITIDPKKNRPKKGQRSPFDLVFSYRTLAVGMKHNPLEFESWRRQDRRGSPGALLRYRICHDAERQESIVHVRGLYLFEPKRGPQKREQREGDESWRWVTDRHPTPRRREIVNAVSWVLRNDLFSQGTPGSFDKFAAFYQAEAACKLRQGYASGVFSKLYARQSVGAKNYGRRPWRYQSTEFEQRLEDFG